MKSADTLNFYGGAEAQPISGDKVNDGSTLRDANATKRARLDTPAERHCLSCKRPFASEGFGNRICTRCKGSSVWRGAVTEGISTGRHRGSRTS